MLSATSTSTVHAGPKEDCIAAVDAGQRLREEAKLQAARAQFLLCAAQTCPVVLQRDCQTFLEEVEAELPTVIFRAFDHNGQDVVDGRVLLDGQPFRDALNGVAMPVDPGRHLIRFEAPARRPVDVPVVIVEREKARVISVRFSAPPPPPSIAKKPAVKPPLPATVWAFGSLGLLGVGMFVGLGASANSDLDGLRAHCAPNCPDGEVDAVRRKAVAADVSLAFGVVGLAAAAYSFVNWHHSTTPPVVRQGTLSSTRYGVDVRGVGGGAMATFQGTF